jgi:hypothetical protein
MKHPESELQQACVKWFKLQYPQYKNLLFAIPNGGKRNAREAARLKAEGVVAGVPDLMLAVATVIYKGDHAETGEIGLFIEMKDEGKQPTPKQKQVQAELAKQGYFVRTCRNFDEFKLTIKNYLT